MLNMKRPSDQAKLLFFALLRGTVSALATRDSKAALAAAVTKNCVVAPSPPLGAAAAAAAAAAATNSAHIQLRLARRTDIPSIQQCNIATLPENYNNQFYNAHLRQWSDLALVAEYIPEGSSNDNHKSHSNKHSLDGGSVSFRTGSGLIQGVPSLLSSTFPLSSHFSSSLGVNANTNNNNDRVGEEEPNVIAYVLGKVQEEGCYGYEQNTFYDENEEQVLIGHVTSLAVLPRYRRNGLAAALMNQLHFHLRQCYGVSAVGLHVRKTNEAACHLYQNFGYEVDRVIYGYYQDGEDAYFMKKTFQDTKDTIPSSRRGENSLSYQQQQHQHDQHHQQRQTTSNFSFPKLAFLGRRPRPWEVTQVAELKLPRRIDLVNREEPEKINDGTNTDATSTAGTIDDETPELLRGTM